MPHLRFQLEPWSHAYIHTYISIHTHTYICVYADVCLYIKFRGTVAPSKVILGLHIHTYICTCVLVLEFDSWLTKILPKVFPMFMSLVSFLSFVFFSLSLTSQWQRQSRVFANSIEGCVPIRVYIRYIYTEKHTHTHTCTQTTHELQTPLYNTSSGTAYIVDSAL